MKKPIETRKFGLSNSVSYISKFEFEYVIFDEELE